MIVAWTQTLVETSTGVLAGDFTNGMIAQEIGLLATREGPTRGFDMAVQPEEPPFVGDVV